MVSCYLKNVGRLRVGTLVHHFAIFLFDYRSSSHRLVLLLMEWEKSAELKEREKGKVLQLTTKVEKTVVSSTAQQVVNVTPNVGKNQNFCDFCQSNLKLWFYYRREL